MATGKKKTYEFDLGKSGKITCFVSPDAKRLLIQFDTREEGLSKTGLNIFIESLKRVRDTMER
ncbi:MAG: hypothetical protein JSR18_08610 [Proteobacteria bacterium]|nr:hypothetical protein [Pseudomonadota bacterium]